MVVNPCHRKTNWKVASMFVARFELLLVLSLGLLVVSSEARAQKPGQKPMQKPGTISSVETPAAKEPAKAKPFAKETPKARPIAITPERESAVVSFVERNHAELAELLAHLKTNQPKEYDRALRDLFRVTEKLAMVHERDSRQYDLELKSWKAQSRAQLLVARLKMTDPESGDVEELKKQLRETLSEQMQARLEVMKLERERVTGRLEKLDEDISRLEK